jgi:hypothetical protein
VCVHIYISGEEEGLMWKLKTPQMEELQLLSFVALAGLDPEVRTWTLDNVYIYVYTYTHTHTHTNKHTYV